MVYWYANIRRVGVETKNMRLKVLKRKTEKLQPYLKISMVVLIILYLVISVLFRYEDTVSYTVWSVNFWDLLFQGRLGDYYSYSHENLRQAPHGLFCGSYLTVFPGKTPLPASRYISYGFPMDFVEFPFMVDASYIAKCESGFCSLHFLFQVIIASVCDWDCFLCI